MSVHPLTPCQGQSFIITIARLDRSGLVVLKRGDGIIQAQQLYVIEKLSGRINRTRVRHIAEIVFDGCGKLKGKFK